MDCLEKSQWPFIMNKPVSKAPRMRASYNGSKVNWKALIQKHTPNLQYRIEDQRNQSADNRFNLNF